MARVTATYKPATGDVFSCSVTIPDDLLMLLESQATLFAYETEYFRTLADFAGRLAELERWDVALDVAHPVAHVRIDGHDQVLDEQLSVAGVRQVRQPLVHEHGGFVRQRVAAADDPAIRVITLCGEGEDFTGGNDLADFMQALPRDSEDIPVWRLLRALARPGSARRRTGSSRSSSTGGSARSP